MTPVCDPIGESWFKLFVCWYPNGDNPVCTLQGSILMHAFIGAGEQESCLLARLWCRRHVSRWIDQLCNIERTAGEAGIVA